MTKPNRKQRGVAHFLRDCWSQLWRFLITGLLVWIPLIISLWVSWFFINKLVLGVEDLIRGLVTGLNTLGDRYAFLRFFSVIRYHFGLGFLIALALFLTTGFLTRYLLGRQIIALGERILHRIPFISKVYKAVQQIRDTFVGRQGTVFQKVCLVHFFHPELLMIGFITSTDNPVIKEATGKDLTAVFVPTTPNPTSGYLFYLPQEDITVLDMTVEEAMKCIVSGGTYMPRPGRPQPLQRDEDDEQE
ncbi:MAG: DUF502 domain-containing protein [Candidatus Hydrogenedentes bacterium]|nr:DUF502 domain-containing protein [Candidatus Hydrogenedentota bacterium]